MEGVGKQSSSGGLLLVGVGQWCSLARLIQNANLESILASSGLLDFIILLLLNLLNGGAGWQVGVSRLVSWHTRCDRLHDNERLSAFGMRCEWSILNNEPNV